MSELSSRDGHQASEKKRIAILGGGCGAISAAYALTATEELRETYEITIYQQGWRLGGKGGTGRNQTKGLGDRIEEHGIHTWMGFYENAFHMIRECYRELDDASQNGLPNTKIPFRTLEDGFTPQYLTTLQEQLGSYPHLHWKTWNLNTIPMPGTPGDGADYPTIYDIMLSLLRWLKKLLIQLPEPFSVLPEGCRPPFFDRAETLLKKLKREVPEPQEKPKSAKEGHGHFWDSIQMFEGLGSKEMEWNAAQGSSEYQETMKLISDLLAGFQEWLHSTLELFGKVGEDIRRIWILIDIGIAGARGLLVDVIPNGFDSINHLDFREWLKHHGANHVSLWSAPLRGLYDMVFAYPSGNSAETNGRTAAGPAIHGILLIMFGFKGAPLWKMKAGMGDTIFAPLYLLLKMRGVKFKFFHRIKELILSPDQKEIQTIKMAKQAALLGQNEEYNPLIHIDVPATDIELPCWPDRPIWGQIKRGNALRKKLSSKGLTLESAWCHHQVEDVYLTHRSSASDHQVEKGEVFDSVILGISIAALPPICKELQEVDSKWKAMFKEIKTVSTQSFQIWLKPTIKELGWQYKPTIMAGYEPPFDSWSEESFTLEYESWGEDGPKAVEYFCGCLRDTIQPFDFSDEQEPALAHHRVKQNAMWWLQEHAAHIWPRFASPEEVSIWEDLYAPEQLKSDGPTNFSSQYWRANIDPSERYVLSVPGSIKYRLHPGKSGFSNLFLAGDWTQSQINGGSVEGAVQSGLEAASSLHEYEQAEEQGREKKKTISVAKLIR